MSKAVCRKRIVLFLTATVTFGLGLVLSKLQPNQRLQDFQLYATNTQIGQVKTPLTQSFPTPMEPSQVGENISDLVFRLMFCQLPVEVSTLENHSGALSLSEYPLEQSTLFDSSQLGCTQTS